MNGSILKILLMDLLEENSRSQKHKPININLDHSTQKKESAVGIFAKLRLEIKLECGDSMP